MYIFRSTDVYICIHKVCMDIYHYIYIKLYIYSAVCIPGTDAKGFARVHGCTYTMYVPL